MKKPLISVLMGIYNCSATLPEAIQSIQNQTVKNWELIICDDGSIDESWQIAEDFRKLDNRIILLRNSQNCGLNITLNKCLLTSRGEFIARMDGDDRCLPERFEKELNAFHQHPDISIVSTDMEFFDETGVWGRISQPDNPKPGDLVRRSPFCHAACMIKRDALVTVGGYSVSNRLLRVEDYHLWLKLYQAGYRGMNLHEALYQMRDDRKAYHRRTLQNRLNESYVKSLVIKAFHLSPINYIYVIRPILVGMLPQIVYDVLHKKKLSNGINNKK